MSVDPIALAAAGDAADAELSQEPVGAAKKACAARWLELQVLGDRNKPYADESVLLYIDRNNPLAAKTNAEGIARWDALPDGEHEFHAQLVDVLEAWLDPTIKDPIPKPDPYRKGDTTTHRVLPMIVAAQQPIVVNQLTHAHKLAHFVDAFVDNKAIYIGTTPGKFDDEPPRWHWNEGAVCNQLVNFFLSYWFNYNKQFTSSGSQTFMGALPTVTSKNQLVWNKVTHRGFREFLTQVTGGEHPYTDKRVAARDGKYSYFRISRYFEKSTGTPRQGLFERLADVNVYSLSDLTKSAARPLAAARAWLEQHPDRIPGGKSSRKLTNPEVWNIVWDLDESDAENAKLQKTLGDCITIDHHAGVLYKRDGKLFQFAADGYDGCGWSLVEKSFLIPLRKRTLFYLALWRVDPLRPGGYAPTSGEVNEGEISVDNASRLIFWGGPGPKTTAKKTTTGK